MNGIFFFLPFLLVASIGLTNNAYADETIVGETFTDSLNPDGTRTFTTHEPYIFDGVNFVPYIQNGLTVESLIGDVTLNPDGSYTWNGKFDDSIIGKYADISDLTTWTYPNGLNNDVPDVSFSNSEFHSNKIQAGVADMDYKYVFKNGKWKTELIVTNLSGLTTKVFGFDQIINLNTDSIEIDGRIYNIDNFDGTVLNKLFLDHNEGKVLDLMNGVNFDFDLGYENLYSVTIHDTGVNSSQLVLDYRTNTILLPGETLIIDPTFSQSSTSAGRVWGAGQSGTACNPTKGAGGDASAYLYKGKTTDSTVSTDCQVGFFVFDVSTVDDGITSISSASLEWDTTTKTGTPTACDLYVGTETTQTQQMYDDGTRLGSPLGVEAVDASTACENNGTGHLETFNTAGKNEIISIINSGTDDISIVFGFDDWTRDASTNYILNTNAVLEIVYQNAPVPDAITDLTYANLDGNSLDLIWTEPGLNGGNVTNYMVNSTTPWSSSTNFLANSTNLYYNVTGLPWGTEYSFSVSVLTEGGYNFTGNVLNITTTSPLYTGVAPTGLTVNDCYHTCTTQLNLEWTATLMDSINGFRIFFETPIGNGFTTLTSNTTTTTTYYNDTGLTPGVFYNYKVAALNGSGISENSTAYAQSPHKLPNSVTDLVITPNDLLQFLGSWTAPSLFGTLNGYQVNYTTPAGDPQTIYTSTEPTTSTTVSGLNPTVEYSFRVAANTYHGINATYGNIENATASSEIEVGDLSFDPGINPDVEPIWFENYIVDSTTNDVQVRFDSALTVDCTVTERIANNVNTYTGLSETAGSGYVYHNFTVTNAGNDILDWDCYDQTDSTIDGKYSLAQSEASSGVGGIGNIPLFSQMNNFTAGLYGTEGDFAGIDLITLFIVIVSMLGFNKKNPALGVGIMATMLGAAWYFELIPWTSGVLGGIAVVLVLAIGQGTKRD